MNVSFTKRLQTGDLDVSIPSSRYKLCCRSFSSNRMAIFASRSSFLEGMGVLLCSELSFPALFPAMAPQLKSRRVDAAIWLQIALPRKQSQNCSFHGRRSLVPQNFPFHGRRSLVPPNFPLLFPQFPLFCIADDHHGYHL